VLISSSGAAIGGSPLSGGYAGAKRMLWIMASYANGVAVEQDLGIRFQALVPQQMTAAGGVGRAGAEAYARRKGVTPEQFLAGFGKPLSAHDFGEHVAGILTEPQYEEARPSASRPITASWCWESERREGTGFHDRRPAREPPPLPRAGDGPAAGAAPLLAHA